MIAKNLYLKFCASVNKGVSGDNGECLTEKLICYLVRIDAHGACVEFVVSERYR